MVEIILDGKVIRRSQNLRGLISHAGRVGVHKVSVYAQHGVLGLWASNDRHYYGKGFVYVEYRDGSICRTEFAEFGIARDFFRARWKRWGLYAEVRNSDSNWSFI